MPQTISGAIRESIELMRSNSETSRKATIDQRLNYIGDNFKVYIEEELKEQFAPESYENIKVMIDDSINLAGFITDEVASIYNGEATRKLDVDSPRYDELKKEIPFDIIMDVVNKLTFALNECVIGVMYREGNIMLDVYPPSYVAVQQDANDPRKITALMYEICPADSTIPGVVNRTGYNPKRNYVYWDVYGNHFKFDENYLILPNEENKDNLNPYKDPLHPGRTIIPFVITHKSYNTNTIWDGTSGNKMFSAHKQIGVISSLLNYYLKVMSVKQYCISGSFDVKATNKQLLDPLHVFKVVGDGASVSVLDMQADFEQFEKQLLKKIERALNQEGLSLESFQKTGSAESGFKLKIKREPLLKKINGQKPFYRIYEAELFSKLRIVNNTMCKNKEQIPDKAVFSIDFAEFTADDDPLTVDKHRIFEYTYNLKTPLDSIREDNPDITDEDAARKVYDDNKRINDELKGSSARMNGVIDGALNAPAAAGGDKTGADNSTGA